MKKTGIFLATFALANAAVISDIEFSGLLHLSPLQAQKISTLQVGEKADEMSLDKALKRLHEYGLFNDVSIFQDEKGKVKIQLSEKPFIAKIDIKGAPSNDKKPLEQVLGLKRGQAIDKAVLALAQRKVNAFYESKGFYDTTVDIEQKPLDDNATALIVHVNRGENVIIKKVDLVGAKKLKYGAISDKIANRSREAMGWMWGFDDGKLRLADLALDSERIRDEYLKRGFFDVKVSPAYLSANMQNYTAELSYYIDEGERYKIRNVEIKHPLEDEINISLSELKTRQNKFASSEKLRKDIAYIQGKFQDLGYALVSVNPIVNKNDEEHEISVVFDVRPGRIYRIAQVIIDGNDKSSDKIVRRELYLTEGMQYSKKDLEDSIIALKKTGFFKDVQIIPETSFEPDALNLRVKITERATGAISGGIGYSTVDGFLISGSVSDRNVLGSGLAGSISLEKNKKDLNGSLRLSNPRLFDTKVSTFANVYSKSHDWGNYEDQRRGIELGLGKEFGRNIALGARYNFENNDVRKATVNMILSGEKLGKSTKSSITPYVVYDSTDDYFLPRNGIYARAAFTYAGLGGDEDYQKLTGDFKYYCDLQEAFDVDLILRFRTSASKIFGYDKTRINSRLYLGGASSVRGFEPNSISPKGVSYYFSGLAVEGDYLKNIQKITKKEYDDFVVANPNQSELEKLLKQAGIYEYDKGGSVSMNSSIELNFPISQKLGLRGSIFYDYGMIGERNLDEIKRSSYGISLNWNTPMGPLNFIFSQPIDADKEDKTSKFEFSIDSQF